MDKYFNSLDIFYDVSLPDVFILHHPVGAISGRAEYRNYLVIYQIVAIGGNVKGEYPKIGEGVAFYYNAKFIENCKIGSDPSFAAGHL